MSLMFLFPNNKVPKPSKEYSKHVTYIKIYLFKTKERSVCTLYLKSKVQLSISFIYIYIYDCESKPKAPFGDRYHPTMVVLKGFWDFTGVPGF